MKRFIEEVSRAQVSSFPECLDDFVAEDNPICVVEAFVEQLDLVALEFDGVTPAATGRPSYHPSVLLPDIVFFVIAAAAPLGATLGAGLGATLTPTLALRSSSGSSACI